MMASVVQRGVENVLHLELFVPDLSWSRVSAVRVWKDYKSRVRVAPEKNYLARHGVLLSCSKIALMSISEILITHFVDSKIFLRIIVTGHIDPREELWRPIKRDRTA